MVAACVPAAGNAPPAGAEGVSYAGDIAPTVPRPAFAQLPGEEGPAGPDATAAAPPASGTAPDPDPASPSPGAAPAPDIPLPAAIPERPGEGNAFAAILPAEPSTDAARASAGSRPAAAAPSGLSLGEGAGDLTASDWVALAEVAREQRRTGAMVRVEIYRPAADPDAADPDAADPDAADPDAADPDGGDRSPERALARANAMAAALVRLGVDAERIDVATVDRPPEDGAGAPRVFLDSDGAPG